MATESSGRLIGRSHLLVLQGYKHNKPSWQELQTLVRIREIPLPVCTLTTTSRKAVHFPSRSRLEYQADREACVGYRSGLISIKSNRQTLPLNHHDVHLPSHPLQYCYQTSAVNTPPPPFRFITMALHITSDQVQEILVPFLGALQASIAVLLTIFAGVIAAQFDLLTVSSAKEISKLCVKLFLPALLIVNVGSQLHLDTVGGLASMFVM